MGSYSSHMSWDHTRHTWHGIILITHGTDHTDHTWHGLHWSHMTWITLITHGMDHTDHTWHGSHWSHMAWITLITHDMDHTWHGSHEPYYASTNIFVHTIPNDHARFTDKISMTILHFVKDNFKFSWIILEYRCIIDICKSPFNLFQ